MNRGTPAWDQLSTDSAQLLLCDLQPEIVACSKTIHRDALSNSAGVLLEIAKVFSLPTTLSVVPEGDKAPELISELRGSGFAQEKLRASAKPVLRCGYQEFARAVQAQDSDHWWIRNGSSGVACGARRPRASLRGVGPSGRLWRNIERIEQAALRQIVAAGAITTSVVSIATKLAPEFTTDLGKHHFNIVQKLRLT
jgi:hypothetical protein